MCDADTYPFGVVKRPGSALCKVHFKGAGAEHRAGTDTVRAGEPVDSAQATAGKMARALRRLSPKYSFAAKKPN